MWFRLDNTVTNRAHVSLFPSTTFVSRLDKIWRSSRAVTSSLAFISSCANPILYTFAGRSYIKNNGLAFMARLFEGTALDSGTRKTRTEAMGLKTTDSSTNAEGQAVRNGTTK